MLLLLTAASGATHADLAAGLAAFRAGEAISGDALGKRFGSSLADQGTHQAAVGGASLQGRRIAAQLLGQFDVAAAFQVATHQPTGQNSRAGAQNNSDDQEEPRMAGNPTRIRIGLTRFRRLSGRRFGHQKTRSYETPSNLESP